MELTHEFTVPAPIDQVWDTFMDLERVGGCFPGATVTEANGDEFSGSVKVKLGPIALVYNGSGRFVERDEQARRAAIEAKGKDKRGNGTAGANVTVQLTEEGAGTHVKVGTDLSITGKPAQFGRGVIQDVSDKLLARFVDCIEQQLAGSGPADAVPAAGAAASGAGAVAGTGTAAGTVAGPAATTQAPARKPAPAPAEDEALDLGGAVLPVIAKQAAPAVGGLIALILGGWLFKRLRGRRSSNPLD